jgi:transposase-like protein
MVAQRKYPDELRERAVRMVLEYAAVRRPFAFFDDRLLGRY